MANDFMAVGSALYARLGTVQYTYNGSGTVPTTGTLGTYDSIAVQGTAVPYVIFQHQASVDEYRFSGGHGESSDYLVKAVSNRTTASAQAFAIYGKAHEVLQYAPLTVSGGQLLRCWRTSRFQYRDNDGYWHVGGIYRIDTWDNV